MDLFFLIVPGVTVCFVLSIVWLKVLLKGRGGGPPALPPRPYYSHNREPFNNKLQLRQQQQQLQRVDGLEVEQPHQECHGFQRQELHTASTDLQDPSSQKSFHIQNNIFEVSEMSKVSHRSSIFITLDEDAYSIHI